MALGGFGVSLAVAATALALPPSNVALVAATWAIGSRVVDEFELGIWTDGPVAVTAAELFGAELHDKVIAPTDMTSATASTDLVAKAGHGYLTGDGPVRLTTAGTLPGGTALATDYWIIKIASGTFKLAASLADALAGTAIDLTVDAVGTLTVTGAAAQRVYWHSHGLIGIAGDGAIALDVQKGYLARFKHSLRTIAYSVVATLDTGAVTLAVWPRTWSSS